MNGMFFILIKGNWLHFTHACSTLNLAISPLLSAIRLVKAFITDKLGADLISEKSSLVRAPFQFLYLQMTRTNGT